jgi:ATP-binding cassette, subfamily A (ABC1), member 3
VTSIVKKYVPQCELERYYGKEVTYTLPLESVDRFSSLFDSLEREGSLIGVESVAISMTTLEEVFLRIGYFSIILFLDVDHYYYCIDLI